MKFETGSKGDFKLASPGPQVSRIFQVIDLGTQPGSTMFPNPKRKVQVGFELADQMTDDGKPFIVYQQYTQSMNENSTLRHHLEGWAGKAMTDEVAAAFNIKGLLGKPCIVQLVENSKGDKKYINVKGILPLMAGQVAPVQVNPSVYFDLDDFDGEVFSNLSKWTQEKIAGSPEYKNLRDESLGAEAETHEDKTASDSPF